MLGGCSLGSIFANLCVAAPVSKKWLLGEKLSAVALGSSIREAG